MTVNLHVVFFFLDGRDTQGLTKQMKECNTRFLELLGNYKRSKMTGGLHALVIQHEDPDLDMGKEDTEPLLQALQ